MTKEKEDTSSFVDGKDVDIWCRILRKIEKAKILSKKEQDTLNVIDSLVLYEYEVQFLTEVSG